MANGTRGHDAFQRKQIILGLIPKNPGRITTAEIHEELRDRYEYKVDRRTVQRDIDAIRNSYPLASTEETTPGHYWPKGAEMELIPGHDDYSALTWILLEDYLAPMIPSAMRKQAQPAFDTARRHLEKASRDKIQAWHRRVRIIPRALALTPPEIDEAVQAAVYEALWDEDRLIVHYASRSGNETRQFSLHPQGLVFRDGVGYLLAVVDGYDDVRHFALHRIEQAQLEYRDADMVEDFDLDAYIADGGFAYRIEPDVQLELRINSAVAHHLRESPLAANQEIRDHDDDTAILNARVADTLQLRWWLLGFGSAVEVLAPATLREFMASQARAMADRYQD